MGVETTLQRWAGVLLLLTCVPAWACVRRVTTTGSKFNDGGSWLVPADLQQALSAPAICTEICVAKSIYKPTTGSDRTVSFVVASGVGVYGGFANSETDRAQANPTANLAILSGDHRQQRQRRRAGPRQRRHAYRRRQQQARGHDGDRLRDRARRVHDHRG